MWLTRCQLCLRRAGSALCPGCWGQIPQLEAERHSFVLTEPDGTVSHPHIAYAAYASPLKQILYTVKYHGARSLARSLGAHLGRWYLDHWPRPDLLVPIPLHPERQSQRGYNQAEELARGMGEVLERPCVRLLERSVNTPALYELSAAERQQALQQAFRLQRSHSAKLNSRILLIDDIITTGSTLLSAADCLKPLSVRLVSLSLARAMLSDRDPELNQTLDPGKNQDSDGSEAS
ncbi:MAG TPA: ComF family protein [Candidatus Obscuribacterales bacterium]